jgi:hypothetical protein
MNTGFGNLDTLKQHLLAPALRAASRPVLASRTLRLTASSW